MCSQHDRLFLWYIDLNVAKIEICIVKWQVDSHCIGKQKMAEVDPAEMYTVNLSSDSETGSMVYRIHPCELTK